ncbi:MAG: transporter associated domain-containing protein, partial [Methanomicrobium sp.]|nr:transporter associated domain-containing protein [Methanomicrobium sp.]
EDILEELVGEILDEFDEEEPQIQIIENGIYLIDAGAWVSRINEEIMINLPLDESYESLGGLLIDRLGHIPKRGEVICLESGIKMQVMKMRGRRIVNIRLTMPEEESDKQ